MLTIISIEFIVLLQISMESHASPAPDTTHSCVVRCSPCTVLQAQPYIDLSQQRSEDDQLFQLLTQIRSLQQKKQEKQAVPLVERALSMAADTVPANDARYIAVLISAGEVYWRLGDRSKAEPLLQRAAQSAESSLAPAHPL